MDDVSLRTAEAGAALPGEGRERRAVLIVNAHARCGDIDPHEVAQQMEEAGLVVEAAHRVARPAELPGLIGDFVSRGERLIVVAGGDGTVRTAVGALAGKEAALGVLPCGTANSFARGLGIPLELPDAIQALADGKVMRVDVGTVDGEHFANSIAIGLAPAISRYQPRRLKRLVGRLSYLLTAAWLLPRFRVFGCTITTESGDRHTFRTASEIRVANGAYSGGVKSAPDAGETGGNLVCYVTPGASKWRLVKSWIALLAGGSGREAEIECFRVREALIETAPRQHVSLDGDALLRTPVRVRVEPNALQVIVPR